MLPPPPVGFEPSSEPGPGSVKPLLAGALPAELPARDAEGGGPPDGFVSRRDSRRWSNWSRR